MSLDALATCLLDIASQLKGQVEPLTLGGGFGLYLKQRHLESQEGLATLIPGELWPPARATEDIDLLLATKVVVGIDQMRSVRKALDELDFAPSVEFMQFEKQTPQGRVKVDLLTGPITPPERAAEARIKPPRVRPRQAVELHAYLTPEAIGTEQGAIMLPISGRTTAGEGVTTEILIPGAFTFLLMKLHAFKDRIDDPRKQLAQHHAVDLYRIVAMLTKAEFDQVRGLIIQFDNEPALQAARVVASEHFMQLEALGPLRVRAYVRDHLAGRFEPDLEAFLAAMEDLFAHPDARG